MNAPEIEHTELQEESEHIENFKNKLAENAANRYIKKHAKEIKRLQEHAKDCLIVNNESGYKYAVNKLRDITRQPKLNDEALDGLWASSKKRTDEFFMEAINLKLQNEVSESKSKETTVPVCSL